MLTMLLTAAAVLTACTAARKALCRAGRRETSHWGGRVRLTALWNDGAAFGLPIGRRTVLAGSLAVLLAAAGCLGRNPAAAGLVLGGGLSNFWERLRRGRVYDYLRFPGAPGPLGRYVYNLADLAVFLGAAGLLLGGAPPPQVGGGARAGGTVGETGGTGFFQRLQG